MDPCGTCKQRQPVYSMPATISRIVTKVASRYFLLPQAMAGRMAKLLEVDELYAHNNPAICAKSCVACSDFVLGKCAA
jgi:hypothetical protein